MKLFVNLIYKVKKIRNAYLSKTLVNKSVRYIKSQFRVTVFIPLSIFFKKNIDLGLNFTDGYKNHQHDKDFLNVNPDNISRIIKAYKLAKLNQKNVKPVHEIKGLWDEWINVNYHEVISALNKGNTEDFCNIFNNIIRNPCTRGLGGYDEWNRYNSFAGKSYIKSVWFDYYLKLIHLQMNDEIAFPKIGNPCGVIYKERIIPIESLRHAYRAEEVKQLLKDLDKKVIVEIGGGYGGFAFQLMSKLKGTGKVKFILFDIPEVVAISSAFLMTAFPNEKFRLYGEGSLSKSNEDYSIECLPHFEIENLDNLSVDLFYNSCSFSEMDEASSKNYLSVIERTCRNYFMHDNHDVEFMFYQPDKTYSTNIIGSKLIPNPSLFKLIFKKVRTHGLPEDKDFIHYEYLYKRL